MSGLMKYGRAYERSTGPVPNIADDLSAGLNMSEHGVSSGNLGRLRKYHLPVVVGHDTRATRDIPYDVHGWVWYTCEEVNMTKAGVP